MLFLGNFFYKTLFSPRQRLWPSTGITSGDFWLWFPFPPISTVTIDLAEGKSSSCFCSVKGKLVYPPFKDLF